MEEVLHKPRLWSYFFCASGSVWLLTADDPLQYKGGSRGCLQEAEERGHETSRGNVWETVVGYCIIVDVI